MHGQELQKQRKAVLAVSAFLLLTMVLATTNAYSQADSPDPVNIDVPGPLNVIEIRHYKQQEGQGQNFIDYFEEHFIVSQEDQGMAILGQLRVIGKPNETVWVRAFENMESRSSGLKGFYFGPVWAKYSPPMAQMHAGIKNAYLLKPLGNIDELTKGHRAQDIAATLASGTISAVTGVVAIDFYYTKPGELGNFTKFFEERLKPAITKQGHEILGHFVSELATNDVPQLPVVQDENLLVVISMYASQEKYQQKKDEFYASEAWVSELHDAAQAMLGREVETLLLQPSLRSPLRYWEQKKVVDQETAVK